jgi:hypothetical protein
MNYTSGKDSYGASKDGYYPPGSKAASYYPPPALAAKPNDTSGRRLLAIADGYPGELGVAPGFGSYISHRSLLAGEDDKKDPECIPGTPFQKKYTECG